MPLLIKIAPTTTAGGARIYVRVPVWSIAETTRQTFEVESIFTMMSSSAATFPSR